VLATTHHDRLKTYASKTPGIVNAAVEFDEVKSPADVPADGGSCRAGSAELRLRLRSGWDWRRRRSSSTLGRCLRRKRAKAADLIAYLHRMPRRTRPDAEHKMAEERQRAGSGAPEAAFGLGGATEAADRGVGKAVRGNAEEIRGERGWRWVAAVKDPRTPRADGEDRAAKTARRARRGEGRAEFRGGADDF